MKDKEVIDPKTKIIPVAYINCLSGTKFIVKTEEKEPVYAFIFPPDYIIKDTGPEDMLVSAVTGHWYRFVGETKSFEYGQRQEELKALAQKLQSEKDG